MAIGAVAGIFHFGLLLGVFRTERLISAIGYIRAFTAMPTTSAVAPQLNPRVKNTKGTHFGCHE